MGVHNEDHEYLVFLHYLYIESFSWWVQRDDEYKPRYRDIIVEINERRLSEKVHNYRRSDVQRRWPVAVNVISNVDF
jgi:hypothetical protein